MKMIDKCEANKLADFYNEIMKIIYSRVNIVELRKIKSHELLEVCATFIERVLNDNGYELVDEDD